MFNAAERARMPLTHPSNIKAQINLLCEMDRHFKRYEVEFEPADASAAADNLGRPDLAAFITEANSLLKDSNAHLLHSVRLGRMFETRLVIIDLFRGAFPDADKLADEVEAKASSHGAIRSGTEEGPVGVEVWARWNL